MPSWLKPSRSPCRGSQSSAGWIAPALPSGAISPSAAVGHHGGTEAKGYGPSVATPRLRLTDPCKKALTPRFFLTRMTIVHVVFRSDERPKRLEWFHGVIPAAAVLPSHLGCSGRTVILGGSSPARRTLGLPPARTSLGGASVTASTKGEKLLRVESIETFYGKLKVLVGVSLELTAGQLVAVIGANGAGKSTLLRTIMGITPAEYGTIEFLGRRIEEEDPDEITRLGISMVPEGRWIFTDLTVQENLDMGAFTRSDKGGIREDFQRVYSMFPALKDRARQRAGLLSGGEQQMLAIGRGLMSRPKLLMLDEPSLGLSPILVREIFRIIKAIHQQGTPILLVEQNMAISMAIADYAYVMETGRMRLSGVPERILADEDVREFYLGEGKGKYISRKDRWKGRM